MLRWFIGNIGIQFDEHRLGANLPSRFAGQPDIGHGNNRRSTLASSKQRNLPNNSVQFHSKFGWCRWNANWTFSCHCGNGTFPSTSWNLEIRLVRDVLVLCTEAIGTEMWLFDYSTWTKSEMRKSWNLSNTRFDYVFSPCFLNFSTV